MDPKIFWQGDSGFWFSNCDDIEARVKFGKVFCGGDEGYLANLGVLLVIRQRIGNGVRLLVRKWKGSVVHKILDFMLETVAVVGVMAEHLVVGTIGVWVMVRRKLFGWLLRFEWLDEVFVKEFFVYCDKREGEWMEYSSWWGSCLLEL